MSVRISTIPHLSKELLVNFLSVKKAIDEQFFYSKKEYFLTASLKCENLHLEFDYLWLFGLLARRNK